MYFFKVFIILIFSTLAVFNFYSMKVNADDIFKSSDNSDLKMRIVQWDRDESAKKITWLIGSDGHRRLIDDESTLNCLKNNAELKGPDLLPAKTLDKYFYIKNSVVVCGARSMGINSQLEIGTYIEHVNGAKLILTHEGLFAISSRGQNRWAPVGKGNRFILQEDQNLVLYKGDEVVWTSNTKNSGANRLSIGDRAIFVLYDKYNNEVWSSDIHFNEYRSKIVYWKGDSAQKKIHWLVGADGRKRRINDVETYECLKNVGYNKTYPVSGKVLDHMPESNNVLATCGNDRIGPNGSIEKDSYLKAGDYKLTMTTNDLILTKKNEKIWSTERGGAQLILQLDGNLVEYTSDQWPTWDSDTKDKKPGWLILSDDGALNLYDGNDNRIWKPEPKSPELYL